MSQFKPFRHPYPIQSKYARKVAYFCMEFGIAQPLKIYSGGLGYLAGSHLRSAYALRQNLIGIGILWKYGYYDQVRKGNNEMDVLFQEKSYNFLQDTGIEFTIQVNRHPVRVKVWYLPPEVFGTAPLFLLSTQHPANDYLAQTICHHLYTDNVEAKIAQYILLGKGGARLLEILGWEPEVYHLNEAHALPAAFHLYERLGSVREVRKRLVFTTHTPVEAGNEVHDLSLLERMGFFGNLPLEEVRRIAGLDSEAFNQSLVALRLSKLANGVSRKHGRVAREMWGGYEGICPITHITNAQNFAYWHDPELYRALEAKDDAALRSRKFQLKKQLFDLVADQTGKLFDPQTLTLVWARRFAAYKRPDLIVRDFQRFERIVKNSRRPIQIIWAGKPYPSDYGAIGTFNHLVHLSKKYPNLAVLTGYELALSKALKQGADVWLNNPRIPLEASGTSGMTAAMNGAVNLSTQDGWIPEFARHGHNAFVVPVVDPRLSPEEQDAVDGNNLLDALEFEVLPTYYEAPEKWWAVVRNGMREILPFFDSDRMADQYYRKIYEASYLMPRLKRRLHLS